MADKIYLKSVFAYREDTLKNWEDENPVLHRGEPAIVRDGLDGKWLKIGDGVTPFKSLPWKTGPKGEQGRSGENYQLSDFDKKEIAEMVAARFTDVSEVGV